MFGSVLSSLFAIAVIFPFIVTFITLLIYKKLGRAPASVLGEAADWTTPFLFLSVYIVAHEVFGLNTGFYLLLTFVSLVIIFAIYERVKVKEFRVIRLMRKTWRISFMLLLVAYIGLLIAGVVLKIVDYAQ